MTIVLLLEAKLAALQLASSDERQPAGAVMANLIIERVRWARDGSNPYVICKMTSGWLVIGDVQPLPGYCLLLSDPVVASLNDLDLSGRAAYAQDMARIGDALLALTDAFRINYETWGNTEPALHTHIMPRYMSEPEDKRRRPACMGYDWSAARKFDPEADAPLIAGLRDFLA
jgi:diadenosine tetraphosphate (Ap4A) HIT family hydrolase